MRVAVIGAGITGLSTALELRTRGVDVTLFEASGRVGGVITTIERDGYLVEAGPTSLTATTALEGLIDRLGLGDQRVMPAGAAKRRFIVRDGVLCPLPHGPGSLVASKALSGSAKLRLMREPFVSAVRDAEDESIASLVRRRLGDEILTYLVGPFVSGVYAGDPERLSARYAMPMLFHAERRHGSLLVGGMREAKAKQGVVRQKGITSFRDGLATLPTAMHAALGSRVVLGTRVVAVVREGDQWRLQLDGSGERTSTVVDAVIYAGPAHAIGGVGLPTEAQQTLAPVAAMHHPPVATMALGFPREAVEHALDGFGMLCPAVEGRTILGAIFSSSLFPGRAPDGHVLITCFLGGAREPGTGRLETAEVLPLVQRDLRELIGATGEPTFVHHQRWARAIPQYQLGHDAVVSGAARAESACPGLYLTGQWRAGVALGECIAQGQEMAARVVAERWMSGAA